MQIDFKHYRHSHGLMWPAADTETERSVEKTVADIREVTKHCPKRRMAIQAGGNCGVWPMRLAEQFDEVVTFEPDPINFLALVVNCRDFVNILALPVALGEDPPSRFELSRMMGNCGATRLIPNHSATDPSICVPLDVFKFRDVDLIYLDIEGMEYWAIRGADETIRRSSPVVCVEDKGLSEEYYRIKKGRVLEYLETQLDYRVVDHVNRDYILKRKV